MNLVAGTKDWLTSSHILVPDDWLQACIEWIQEENQGKTIPQMEMNSLVYEQWLLADLHELQTQCPPNELAGSTKYQLTGAYALQIDSIVDVGKSFYSQQQKLKGTENENTKVSADEPTQKPWEQKPSRMLLFKLTDGKVALQGMEYRPISCINPQTSPGTKILVYGSVLCRHGILMLEEKNIKFLGGEVDTLVEANTVAATLQSAIEGSLEHGEKHHRQEFNGSEIRRKQKPVQPQQSGHRNSVVQSQQSGQRNSMGVTRDARSGNHQQGRVKTEIQSQNFKADSGRNSCLPVNTIPPENQWDDDAELYDAFMDDMEVDEMDEPSPHGQPLQRNLSVNAQNSVSTQNNKRGVPPDNRKSNVKNKHSNKNNFTDRVKMEFADRTETSRTFSRTEASVIPDNQGDEFNDDFDDFATMDEELEYLEQLATSQHVTANANVTSDRKTSMVQKNRMTVNSKTEHLVPQTGEGNAHVSTDTVNTEVRSHSSLVSNYTPTHKIKEETVMLSDEDLKIQAEYPFTYLAKVMSLPVQQQPTFHTVKAYISTLTSKLSNKNNKWTLSCKINDGTMAVDVDLSNQVLTEMIGFSPQEAQEMKMRVKSDPSLKDVLTNGIQQCQHKLIELMCLLELEISAKNPRPVIVATKQVTSHHIDMLYNRVMASWGKFN